MSPHATPTHRFYLLTYPRTASNLLVKMLSLPAQDSIFASPHHGGYYFLAPYYYIRNNGLYDKPVRAWSAAEREQVLEQYRPCVAKLEEDLATGAASGKSVFAKEHPLMMIDPVARDAFVLGLKGEDAGEAPWTLQVGGVADTARSSGNDTMMPDAFLETWLPTFLIRHPALAFPSWYRAVGAMDGKEASNTDSGEMRFTMTLHWTRRMYDFYAERLSGVSHGGVSWPLVLDADDVISEPQVTIRFAEILGMDTSKLQFEWPETTKEELAGLPPKAVIMLKSLSASTGLLKEKASGDLDIEAEAKKWREEFGEGEGAKIEKLVRAAMPDYEFLKAKRLRPKSLMRN